MLHLFLLFAFAALSAGRRAGTVQRRQTATLPASIDVAPSIVPTIYDSTAPNSQRSCPGYVASEVEVTTTGLTANLDLAGKPCQTYGNDIPALSLVVQYQDEDRLNVKISPRYLTARNQSVYVLPGYVTGLPQVQVHEINHLAFEWSNSPSFHFRIRRNSTGEIIFDTYGSVIVFQDQFLELVTNVPANYNVYGLPENIHDFRLGNNYTQTFWAASYGNAIDSNAYGSHPIYLETRYNNSNNSSASHGVFARNAHGQEWLLRATNITYRTIGGSFDLYFLNGPQPKDVIAQYQNGIVGRPAMQMYWTFGFHQCRWGYNNWTELQVVVDGYRDANIPLEGMWTDIDAMQQFRDFTNDGYNFPIPEGQQFIAQLHKNYQHYVPIVDSNIYAPNPENASDAYEPFTRGSKLNAFIREDKSSFYYGDQWPGFSVFPDWTVSQSHDFWTHEMANYHNQIPFDGVWVDLSEANSYCVGSCGEDMLQLNPIGPPFSLPGDPGNPKYQYPAGFSATNASAASSASAALASITTAAASSTPTSTRTLPTPGVRNLNFPPYTLNNIDGALVVAAISPNATHNDEFNSTEYELHNVFGHQLLNATYNALLQVFPSRRPFMMGRSTFAGSGKYAGHWGGDNTSNWGSMYLAIAQALQFAIAGIPMFGPDTCGFDQNADFELCSRWMAMSAFFPFYRNHNIKGTISQEAFRWSSVAAASRNAMQIRYSLLPYIYTLFYNAHTLGTTVMTALQWQFPDEEYLKGVDNQFMLGPAILVTPVLQPLVTQVQGVFPGTASGTIWYDWYTLERVDVAPKENKTLAAPLEHINVHVRGGQILPMQIPGYTTTESRQNPFELLVALDQNGRANGSLYLDDGYSVVPNATKQVEFVYQDNILTVTSIGHYNMSNPISNISIAGVSSATKVSSISMRGICGQQNVTVHEYALTNNTLRITSLEQVSSCGVWDRGWELVVEY